MEGWRPGTLPIIAGVFSVDTCPPRRRRRLVRVLVCQVEHLRISAYRRSVVEGNFTSSGAFIREKNSVSFVSFAEVTATPSASPGAKNIGCWFFK